MRIVQGKAATPPATGRGGIQIPAPREKIVVMMSKSEASLTASNDFNVTSKVEGQNEWLRDNRELNASRRDTVKKGEEGNCRDAEQE